MVEKPTALTSDGTVDVSQLPAGVMYTSAGEWVVAEPDKAAWEQFQAKSKASAEKAEALATGNKELSERGLECPIDKRMFVDPMKTPCCGKTFCRDCIENALLGNDFVCPSCSSDNVLVDNLVSDEETVTKMKTYEEEKAQAKKEEKEKSASPAPEKSSVQSPGEQEARKSSSPKPAGPATNGRTASASATPQPTSTDSKKRPAEEPLENPRIPTGPKAMVNKQNSQPINAAPKNDMNQFVQQMNAMSQGLPPNQQGMPFMPPNMNMGFNPMMGMPGMNMMPMNPMMMNGGWGGMGGYGMNGMGGFPQQNQPRNMYGGGSNTNNGGNFNPMGMPNGGAYGAQQWQGGNQAGWNNGNMIGMAPQQQNGFQNGANGEDEDAYFRKPVNPHRHQARNRRQRSVDYREM